MFLGDSLTNLVTGLGTVKDKSSGGRFTGAPLLSPAEVTAMYTGDWIAGTLVDAPPDDMTREWRGWKAGSRQITRLEAVERTFGIRRKVNHALKLARMHGGSAILIGDGVENPDQELNLAQIGRGSLKYVNVLSMYEITAGELERDPVSPYFGQPKHYTLPTAGGLRSQAKIHPSRVVPFHGIAPVELSLSVNGWGTSVLQRVYTAVRNAAATQGNVASMTHEAKTDVISVPGLTENSPNPAYRAKVLARFGLANTGKSISNSLLLDEKEKWQQRQVSFANLSELMRQFIEVAAGAGQMPVTRLLGSAPGGLSNNNDAGLRHYYDTLSSNQETELSPALERLDEVLIRTALGTRPKDVWYVWRPLWQLTDEELSVISLRKAQASQIYAGLGITTPDALAEAIVGQIREDGLYPGFDDIIERAKGGTRAPLSTAKPVDVPRASSGPGSEGGTK